MSLTPCDDCSRIVGRMMSEAGQTVGVPQVYLIDWVSLVFEAGKWFAVFMVGFVLGLMIREK